MTTERMIIDLAIRMGFERLPDGRIAGSPEMLDELIAVFERQALDITRQLARDLMSRNEAIRKERDYTNYLLCRLHPSEPSSNTDGNGHTHAVSEDNASNPGNEPPVWDFATIHTAACRLDKDRGGVTADEMLEHFGFAKNQHHINLMRTLMRQFGMMSFVRHRDGMKQRAYRFQEGEAA
ncbi:hypothetical protein [Nitrospirillum sp. BR 11163]|uniref:hypothetical protein n=1 Tax=Nitrospirillum sp. BR 11163 TaxID=3104323 RepID=UPI002AFFB14C|nr:hypothetical protein [Nitrospirillum sp. BR 11163]MEA1674073.1 hypothetical protein [Nitrospirillum sp. BR 11163]